VSSVTVQIRGKNYTLACDDGQERHLHSLAEELNDRFTAYDTANGKRAPQPESYLWMLTALTLLDELRDTHRELKRLRLETMNSSQSFESGKRIEMEQAMAEMLDDIAARIEHISAAV
jgi:cell division protein ZapA